MTSCFFWVDQSAEKGIYAAHKGETNFEVIEVEPKNENSSQNLIFEFFWANEKTKIGAVFSIFYYQY